MTKVYNSLVFTILFLAGLLFLGWFDIAGEYLIDFNLGMFGMIIVAMISILIMRRKWRITYQICMLFWMVVFLIYAFYELNWQPAVDIYQVSRLIIEAVLLVIAVSLSYDLSRNMADANEFIEQMTITEPRRRISEITDDAMADIYLEFNRARRYKRPLSVVILEPKEDTFEQHFQDLTYQLRKSLVKKYMITSIASMLDKEARSLDMIYKEGEQGRFVIVSPETNTDGSYEYVNRIRRTIKEKLGVDIVCGSSTFPEDALTFEDILQEADDVLKGTRGKDVGSKKGEEPSFVKSG